MEKSLFGRRAAEPAPKATPLDLIEREIEHLKKGGSTRHGAKPGPKIPSWVMLFGFCGLVWVYVMDPVMHAWYKGEAAKVYVYLHNYGSGPMADRLAATQILSPDEVTTLNGRTGKFQGYYRSVEAANAEAERIITYMNNVKLLHDGKYEPLDPLGRMRYLVFIRTGIFLPQSWSFLDPSISG